MPLTKEQLVQNIEAMEKQGANQQEIQGYINSTSQSNTQEKSKLEKVAGATEKFFLSPLSKLFGIEQATGFVGEQGKRIGTGLAQLDPIVREEIAKSPEAFERITGQSVNAGQELRQVGKESLTTAATVAPFAKGMFVGKAAQIGLRGAGIGATRELGESLTEGKDFKDTIIDISKEAGISGATSFLFAKAFEKLPSFLSKKASRQTTRAIRPTKKRLASDLRKQYDSISTRVAKEGYKGSNNSIYAKAVRNKDSFGNAIGKVLDDSDKMVTREGVIKHFDDLFNDKLKMTLLEPREQKVLQEMVKKLPKKISVADANKYKIYFNKQVPQSAWLDGASAADGFRAKLYKSIAGGFRNEINSAVPTVKSINEKWAVANDLEFMLSEKLSGIELTGGAFERLRHGPMATLFEMASAPFTNTPVRTGASQVYLQLAKMPKNELIQKVANMLILRGQ